MNNTLLQLLLVSLLQQPKIMLSEVGKKQQSLEKLLQNQPLYDERNGMDFRLTPFHRSVGSIIDQYRQMKPPLHVLLLQENYRLPQQHYWISPEDWVWPPV